MVEARDELGRGGFSTVYRAKDTDGKEYAVKIYFHDDPKYEGDKSKAIECIRRKSIPKNLDHGSIIKVFRVVEEAELVMFN